MKLKMIYQYFCIIHSQKLEFLYLESGRYSGKKLEEYFRNLQENLSGFERQTGECKQKGLKPANNPAVCTEGDTYEPFMNCKYVDKKNSGMGKLSIKEYFTISYIISF
jgi:hypothetical protein